MMKVSIVILNWNGGADNCIEAIESALEQNYENKEILFVDNASSDGSFDAVKLKWPSELVYIQTEHNLGCPGGRNVGATGATGELVVFLENDGVWASQDVVSAIVEQFINTPSIGALYTRVEGYLSREPDLPIDSSVEKYESKGLYLSSSFRGGASALRRELFNEIGQYPADFVRQYEERYVSLLIYQMGYQVVYFPEKVLLHKGSDYQGKSEAVFQYNCINELKAIRRIYPAYLWVFFFAVKTMLWAGRFLRRKQVSLFIDAIKAAWNNPENLQAITRISLSTLKKIQSIRYRRIADNLKKTGLADNE